MDWNACGGNTVAFEKILICWFDGENYWWNIIKRVICLLRSQTDNPFYNIQIIYVIETTTECVWRMILDVN